MMKSNPQLNRHYRGYGLLLIGVIVVTLRLCLADVNNSLADQEGQRIGPIAVVSRVAVMSSLRETYDVTHAFEAAETELQKEFEDIKRALVSDLPDKGVAQFNSKLSKSIARIESLSTEISLRRAQLVRLRDAQLSLIRNRIERKIEDIARKEGYLIVLEYSKQQEATSATVVWASTEVNISDSIIRTMNNEYKPNK